MSIIMSIKSIILTKMSESITFPVDDQRSRIRLVQIQTGDLPIEYIMHLPVFVTGSPGEAYVCPTIVQLESRAWMKGGWKV